MTETEKSPPPIEEEGLYIAMGGSGWPGREKHTFDWDAYVEKMNADPVYWLGAKAAREAYPERFLTDPVADQETPPPPSKVL